MEVKSKPFWESVSMWGVLITIVAGIGQVIGLNISPDTTQAAIDIVPKAVEAINTKDWIGAINLLVGFVGVVMTTFGRNQAVQPVHFVAPFTVPAEGVVTPK